MFSSQGWLSSVFGHASPPTSGYRMMVLGRVWIPPLQYWKVVQVVHEFHAPTMQSSGQAPLSQGADSSVFTQASPPFSAAVTISRVRVWVPPPHEAEQANHSSQSPITQWTIGHS
jgi:hypothetical protein